MERIPDDEIEEKLRKLSGSELEAIMRENAPIVSERNKRTNLVFYCSLAAVAGSLIIPRALALFGYKELAEFIDKNKTADAALLFSQFCVIGAAMVYHVLSNRQYEINLYNTAEEIIEERKNMKEMR